MEAFIMMIIFAVCLMVSALRLYTTKNPKDSMLMYKVQGLEKMSEEKSPETAQMTAKGVAIVALAPLIGGIVGLFSTTAGGIVLLGGTVVAFVVVAMIFKKK